MFIHTLTFLNISKSPPTKTYLAYLIPNLCFIIQSLCSHLSLKMPSMKCASTLLLCLSILLSPSASDVLPCLHYHFIIQTFMAVFFFKYIVLSFSSFPLPVSLPFLLGSLSFRSPCPSSRIPEDLPLISAVTPPLSLQQAYLHTNVLFSIIQMASFSSIQVSQQVCCTVINKFRPVSASMFYSAIYYESKN